MAVFLLPDRCASCPLLCPEQLVPMALFLISTGMSSYCASVRMTGTQAFSDCYPAAESVAPGA